MPESAAQRTTRQRAAYYASLSCKQKRNEYYANIPNSKKVQANFELIKLKAQLTEQREQARIATLALANLNNRRPEHPPPDSCCTPRNLCTCLCAGIYLIVLIIYYFRVFCIALKKGNRYILHL
jgi:hypothetical protein